MTHSNTKQMTYQAIFGVEPPTTSTSVTQWVATVGVGWQTTGSVSGAAGPYSREATARSTALSNAQANLPSRATVTSTTVIASYYEIGHALIDGWYAEATLGWKKSGTVNGTGIGDTEAKAKEAALAQALQGMPAGGTNTGETYLTSSTTTVTWHATATYAYTE